MIFAFQANRPGSTPGSRISNMNAKITHIQVNVSNFEVSKRFYSELFEILEWKKYMEEEGVISWTSGDFSFWVVKTETRFKRNKFHRKNTGLNHLAFRVNSREEVNKFANKLLLIFLNLLV